MLAGRAVAKCTSCATEEMTCVGGGKESSWEWAMDEDFGFYEDLDGGGSNGGGGGDSYSNNDDVPAAAIISCCSPHRIDDARPETLETSPPILSETMVDQIAEDGLPWSMQDMKWIRIFATSRDGKTFGTFMRSVRNVSHTIIVASTSNGKIVGGFAADVWSGRKVLASSSSSSLSREEINHAFLFVVEPAAANTAIIMTDDADKAGSSLSLQQSRLGRFIPGLEGVASSPTSPIEFDFDSPAISPSKNKVVVDNNKEQQHVHIFKPSLTRPAGLKQVCQLGNKFISLGDEGGEHRNFLAIENSFSRGVTMMMTSSSNSDGGGMITEEFGVVDFEVYCLSDDDD